MGARHARKVVRMLKAKWCPVCGAADDDSVIRDPFYNGEREKVTFEEAERYVSDDTIIMFLAKMGSDPMQRALARRVIELMSCCKSAWPGAEASCAGSAEPELHDRTLDVLCAVGAWAEDQNYPLYEIAKAWICAGKPDFVPKKRMDR
jgi:hypothetical protein